MEQHNPRNCEIEEILRIGNPINYCEIGKKAERVRPGKTMKEFN